ncbi:MAG: phosphoribosyl-ATP diphosphatase [Woeseiaceae bacterium]|nr:phosphoribosyl-ATP diphosphatase [Woeseiaceae bacterium]
MTGNSLQFVVELENIISKRLDDQHEDSYTASLGNAGIKRVAQKVGEEAVELALASIAGDRQEVSDEAADLVYHLLVLLRLQDISMNDVAKTLQDRHVAK